MITGRQAARWGERLSAWCLGALLVTLSLWRHRLLWYRPPQIVFFEFRDLVLYTNELFWWGALGAWLFSRRLRGVRGRLKAGPLFLLGPLAALLGLCLVGIPLAVDPTYAGYQSLRLLLLLTLYLMLVNVSLRPAAIAWPLAGGVLLQAAVALPQFSLGRSLGLKRLGELLLDPAWPGISVVMVGEGRWLRAYGLTQHPNLLGGCLMAMLLVLSGYYLGRSGWERLPLLVVLGLGLAALLVTFSRAAWLGAAAGGLATLSLLILGRLEPRLGWKPVAGLAALGLGVVALFAAANWPLLAPRLGLVSQGVEIRSVAERDSLTAAAWALIRERPLSGVGLGNFPQAMYWLVPEDVAGYPIYQPVHNVALLSTAELGPLGGGLWLILMAAPWLAMWTKRRQLRMTTWLAGLSGALAALAVVSWLDSYVWASHQGRLLQWLVWGLWAGAWGQAVQPDSIGAEGAPQPA